MSEYTPSLVFTVRMLTTASDMDGEPHLPVFYRSTDGDLGVRPIDSAFSLNLATTSSPYLPARVQPTKDEQDPTKTGNSITIAGPAADFRFVKEILFLLTKHCHSPSHQLLPEFRWSVTPLYELLKLLEIAGTFDVPKEIIQAINNSIVSHANTVRFEDASAIINNFPEGDLTHHFLADAVARQCAPMWSTYAHDDEVMEVLGDPKFRETFRPYLETELMRVAEGRRRKDEQQKQELLRLELARKEMLRREEERKQALWQEHAKRCAEATNVRELVWDDDVEEEWPRLG